MQIFLYVFTAVMLAVIAVLSLKIASIKLGLREIKRQLPEIAEGGTNALITISTGDGDVKGLAAELNVILSDLRAKELKYTDGDREVKSALTNAAHDLRTPLTALLGYLDLIADEKDEDKIRGYLSAMHERAYALKKLSEELFTYSVAADRYRRENLRILDAGEVLKECLADFYEAFTKRSITPEISVDCPSFTLTADKTDLIRLYSNIIQNALKYSGGDFKVTLEGKKITFSNTAENIDSIDLGRLFDRFYTVNNGKHSTGLGLSIAKTLTEKSGGKLYATLDGNVLNIISDFTQP